MMLLTAIALILISAASCAVFYNYFSGIVRDDLRQWTAVFQKADTQTILGEVVDIKPDYMRITLIRPNGDVEYDNTARAEEMENHMNREEVAKALVSGAGESRRLSDTIGEETFYFAIKLIDGNVLRVAKTQSSIWGMFSKALPAVLGVMIVVLLVGYLLARNFSKRIVAPINLTNPNGVLTVPYDELAPFIRTIEQQRDHIAEQLADLQNRTDTMNAIMDNMSEGILFVDHRGVIVSINKVAQSIFGAERPAKNSGILETVRDIDLLENVREALAGNRGEIVKEYRSRTYRVFISPVAEGGAIVLLLDITEKAMVEKLRREFSANVSHELKTPLTSISGYAEMLYNGIVGEGDTHALFGKIKDEAQRMTALIDDILLVSRLDEGEGLEAFENVDLCTVAADAAEALSLIADEHGVSVHVACGGASSDADVHSGEGIFMNADRSMMYELFYNLIDNAVKYNKAGGAVDVDVRRDESHAIITVTDTGIGIPEKAHDRVFERFYRVDKSRSKKKGGTGLGLAIVKHIVLIHGGKVSLESREGEGTKVVVEL
jgi:two-component system phosphate regulon sensor histidine kinase PhoR